MVGNTNGLQKSVILQKGTISLTNSIFAGHTSGSGNYVSFFLPYPVVSGVTSATYTKSTLNIYIDGGTLIQASGIDASYCGISQGDLGVMIELKFTSTQAINRNAVLRFDSGNSITFS